MCFPPAHGLDRPSRGNLLAIAGSRIGKVVPQALKAIETGFNL